MPGLLRAQETGNSSNFRYEQDASPVRDYNAPKYGSPDILDFEVTKRRVTKLEERSQKLEERLAELIESHNTLLDVLNKASQQQPQQPRK